MNTWYARYDFFGMYEVDPPWKRRPEENDRFFFANYIPMRDQGICPYCKGKIDQGSIGVRSWPGIMQAFIDHLEIQSTHCDAFLSHCGVCGWWCAFQMSTEDLHSMLFDLIAANWAKIKVFDLTGSEAPLQQLRDALSGQRINLSGFPTIKLTDMITSCFRSHFPCEIIQVGEAGKDPFDTFLVNADKPLLLCVNKQNPNSETSVQVVHELLGLYRSNNRYNAMLVSTEKRFETKGVILPVIKSAGISISLTSAEAVLGMLQRAGENASEPWETIWQEKSSGTEV